MLDPSGGVADRPDDEAASLADDGDLEEHAVLGRRRAAGC
jgi:hypothetical protein